MAQDEGFTFDVSLDPDKEDLQAASKGFTEYNFRYIGRLVSDTIAVYVRDPEGRIIGGAEAHTDAGWLIMGMLFVREPYRGHGFGSKLVALLEEAAAKQGCRHVRLQTYPYQALDFYLRNGYEVFGTLEDYPGEHTRYFLRKDLSAATC